MFALLNGIQLGALIFFLVGPFFFLILEETIKRGRRAALLLVSGLWMSDFIFATVSHFGIHSYLADKEIDYRIGYIAALILVIVGITTIRNRKDIQTSSELKFVKSGNLFLKGFLINTFNPFVLFFWIGVASQLDYKGIEVQLFYFGLFATFISGDLIKIFFSKKISQRLNMKHLQKIRLIGGILLIIFAFVIIFRIHQVL